MIIGVTQIKLTNNINQNFKKIFDYTKLALKKKVDILCFPECALSGYVRDFKKLDLKKTKEAINFLQKFTIAKKINLIIGVPYQRNKKLGNGAVILLKNGRKLIYYKQCLTKFDKKYFFTGKQNLIFKIGNIKCGVAICRDQNDLKIFQNYKKADVKVVFVPAAHYYAFEEAKLKLDKNKALPIARALDNKFYVAKANAVGRVGGKISLGRSLIVDPKGYVVQEADCQKEIILVYKI